MATDKLIAAWKARDLTYKLLREPIVVGEPHEYTLVGIDAGDVRRFQRHLCADKLAYADNYDERDYAEAVANAPANAKRILDRFD